MKTTSGEFRASAVVCLVGLLAFGELVHSAGAVKSRLRASAAFAREKLAITQEAAGSSFGAAAGNATPHKAAQLQLGKVSLGDSEVSAASQEALLQQLAVELLSGKSKRSVMQVVNAAEPKLNLRDALQRVDGKLPSEVASLVNAGLHKEEASTAKGGGAKIGCKQSDAFSEDSLQNARRILNGMIQTAVKELDDEIIRCHEFTSRNRETFEQVNADLAIYGSDLSKLNEERVDHTEGSSEADQERERVMKVMEKELSAFNKERLEDQLLMTERSNDLAVFDFILQLTACGSAPTNCSALLQSGSAKAHCRRPVSLCSTSGEMRLRFNDTKLQRKIEGMMTPGARQALRAALGQVQAKRVTELMQRSGVALAGVAAAGQNVSNDTISTSMGPQVPVDESPVTEEPDPSGQWKKCVDAPYDCGFVHDMMSLEWGKFRDLFDELKEQMGKKQTEHDDLMSNLKEQLSEIVHKKTSHIEGIAAVVSQVSIIQQAVSEKNVERTDLLNEYTEESEECKKTIEHIAFNQVCAVRMIRNSLMGCSTTTPPSNISDCDVSDWVGDRCEDVHGNELSCDDTCPQPNPFDCGGTQTITRDIVVAPNENGLACPELSRQRKCNQFKCAVDCSLSDWSGWGECTKECDSGVQTETRDIFLKPKNGGEACDALDDTRPCHTMSCNRDCTYHDWTDWSSCSMSCSMEGYSGQQTRVRHVDVPVRALGKCAPEHDRVRYEVQECNTHECNGDEICIAHMDLVIAVDGSGSLKEDGFTTLKEFAANLTSRYRGEYYGQSDLKIGVVLFGQGHVETLPNGKTTITPAENALPLTGDMDAVEAALKGLTYQAGFTNVAQALALADVMLQQGGREDAQSAVMVISDGKYSMEYQTQQQVDRLKEKNTMIFMLPVTDFDSEQVETMKTWASEPWETNFERIPGLESLKYNLELFSQRIVAKFCPDSMSPSAMLARETQQEFMMVHENGWPSYGCGAWVYVGHVPSLDDCAREARERGKSAFSFGRSYAANVCYGEAMELTMDEWHSWSIHRRSPPCPNGYWLFNPYFDTYAIMPME